MTESIILLLPFVILSIITNIATARSDRNRVANARSDTELRELVADEAAEFERVLTLTKGHLTDLVGLLNAATAKITNVPLKLIN